MALRQIYYEDFYRNPKAYKLPRAAEELQLNQYVIFKGEEVYKADPDDINNACAGVIGVAGDLKSSVDENGGVVVVNKGLIWVIADSEAR